MKEQIDKHEDIHHMESMGARIDKHTQNCGARSDVVSIRDEMAVIKSALIFLVAKQNGNPKELGLVK